MGVGASTVDIGIMASELNCAFACHVPAAMTTATTTIHRARAAGATLRIDVVKNAAAAIVEDFRTSGASGHLSVGVHTFSNSLTTVLPASSDLDDAINSLRGLELAGDWGQGGTNFHESTDELATQIGVSGSGLSVTDPIKVVMLITDGVATNAIYDSVDPREAIPDPTFRIFGPTYNGNPGDVWSTQGFDPRTCNRFKRQGLKVMTLKFEYTIAKTGTDSDDRFDTIEKFLKGDITNNMSRCASQPEYAKRAENSADIRAAMNSLIDSLYNGGLRLTN